MMQEIHGDLSVTPIVGWRVWLTDGRTLLSPHMKAIWYPHEAFSTNIPEIGNEQGIYSCLTFEHLIENQRYMLFEATADKWVVRKLDSHNLRVVYGRVHNWGTVLEHEQGYRAEYAYPLSISDVNLALRYGCKYEDTPLVDQPMARPECEPTQSCPPKTPQKLPKWELWLNRVSREQGKQRVALFIEYVRKHPGCSRSAAATFAYEQIPLIPNSRTYGIDYRQAWMLAVYGPPTLHEIRDHTKAALGRSPEVQARLSRQAERTGLLRFGTAGHKTWDAWVAASPHCDSYATRKIPMFHAEHFTKKGTLRKHLEL